VPNVTVPAGSDPLIHVWTALAPKLTAAAGGYSSAVYEHSSLSLREFEAARITMARINDCALCLDWRTARDVPSRGAAPDEVPEAFYVEVGSGDGVGLTERERLAAEFAERYATDHRAMDTPFWDRLHAEYTDDELVDLALCVGSWLALGRFNQVFDIDGACRVPTHTAPAAPPAGT
jgi:alkylhydroperoxidase family enzyme